MQQARKLLNLADKLIALGRHGIKDYRGRFASVEKRQEEAVSPAPAPAVAAAPAPCASISLRLQGPGLASVPCMSKAQ